MSKFRTAAMAGSFLAPALLAWSPAALADTSWGAQANTSLFNCASLDCGGGGVSGGLSTFGPNNDNWQVSDATSQVANALGSVEMFANFETAGPGLATGVLTGEATGGPLGAALGTSRTLDQYFYSGPPTSITITATLTGSFTPPSSGADSTLDGISGRLYLFSDPFAISEIDFEESVQLNCLGECYVPDDTAVTSITDGGSTLTATINLDLADGDVFALWGVLNLGGAGNGSATSLNSFRYSFDDTTGLTSLAGDFVGGADADSDGIEDASDNCVAISNSDQRDTNGDGYGNICDADLNNDNVINAIDLGLFKAVFFTIDADADFNGDGIVNAIDLGILKVSFFGMPGPSGLAP